MLSIVPNRLVYSACMNEVHKPIVSWFLLDGYAYETMGNRGGCDTDFVLPTHIENGCR